MKLTKRMIEAEKLVPLFDDYLYQAYTDAQGFPVDKLTDDAPKEAMEAFKEHNRLWEEQLREDEEEYKRTGILF